MLRIQTNTSKEGKTLMKQLKRMSKLGIQRNTNKEGKSLMKHKKRISRLRMQNRIEEKKQYKNGERKSI